MAKLKVYIVGFMAYLPQDRAPVELRSPDKPDVALICHHVGMTLAFSDEEARAWGVEIAKKEMPEEAGYFDHIASVDSIPTDKVRELLRLIDAGEFDKEHEPLDDYFVRGEGPEDREM